MELKRLYSKNWSCREVIFRPWVNIILWERMNTWKKQNNKKTNGVGKSMAIETLRFCLFQDFKSSRLSKIPTSLVIEEEFYLDLLINNHNITIIRSIKEEKNPIIYINQERIHFSKLEEAREYLWWLIFGKAVPSISFRQLLAPLMREEECDYKDVTKYYHEKFDVFEAMKPQAYFFWFNISLLKNIRDISDSIQETRKYTARLTKEIESNWNKVKDVPKTINSIKWELDLFKDKIDKLETNIAMTTLEKDLSSINTEIRSLQVEQTSIISQIQKINSLPEIEKISTNDVKKVYNYFSLGMWDVIKKSLDEVIAFNSKIESFQNILMGKRLSELNSQLVHIKNNISTLEQQRAKNLKLIDNQGLLKDFKDMFSILQSKKNDIDILEYRYKELQKQSPQERMLKAEREKLLYQVDAYRTSTDKEKEAFNKQLMYIRNEIMWNTSISFEIRLSQTKSSILEFILRWESDGSHSVDRVKLFTYDLALMVSEVTEKYHPKYLVHDNIFDVDQDSLIKSLNVLWTFEEDKKFQYILTLNSDRISKEDSEELTLDLGKHTVLELTKNHRFFSFDYEET